MADDDEAAAVAGYELALEGVTFHALGLTIRNVITGEIDGLSHKWCPTAPELSAAVRKQMKLDREFRPSGKTFEPVPFIGLRERVNAARERMASEGRKLLCDGVTHSRSHEMASAGDVPHGSVWVALLGAFYGPANANQPTGENDHE